MGYFSTWKGYRLILTLLCARLFPQVSLARNCKLASEQQIWQVSPRTEKDSQKIEFFFKGEAHNSQNLGIEWF